MNISSTIGGLAGAGTLTLVTEGVKRIDKDAPRMDLLGQNVVAQFIKKVNPSSKALDNLLPIAIGGDLISNSLYYALAKGKTRKETLIRGALLGLGAGIGAVVIPQYVDEMKEEATSRTTKTKLMTVAWYTLGGVMAAVVTNLIDKKRNKL